MSRDSMLHYEALTAEKQVTPRSRRPEDKVIEVTRYAATDGTAFDTTAEAVEYQYELDFEAWCMENLPVDAASSRRAVARAVLEAWHVREKP